ncbi:Co-chaperone HscB, C-terminal oligomerization domain-containing protein [Mycotypha africana]|uniref:Co-chaperone HscB, C-terminal oligomerization domain-containing protein n=1 Tax=Mycotypha africana TaxID=64632 RepID=UPI002301088F|nr:Co-chaperone HscB, C-terminal oligomerization domain-containing protein [Mycotypha africana]KAI8990891.1 Co-chaperone HscB, C-terminal oligomerization domain-containing protein [Mycotypha africana]
MLRLSQLLVRPAAHSIRVALKRTNRTEFIRSTVPAILSRYPLDNKRRFGSTPCFKNRMEHEKICWQCQGTNKLSALFCENKSCGVIQPIPSDLNFFHLMQVGEGEEKDKAKFDIDLKAMRKRFLLLQQQAHPDSYSQKDKREMDYAQLQSGVINKAYHTLKNPLSRAKYMLENLGLPVSESDSLVDPELLMDVMEFREEMEEVQSEEELLPLKERNEEKYNETVDKLASAFAGEDYDTAKTLTIQLQYLTRNQNAIRDWQKP